MLTIVKAAAEDLDAVMRSRIEMLKVVNNPGDETAFDEEFMRYTKEYFESADQTTLLAFDGDVIGCATIFYTHLMPTFDHSSGKRAHIMNVYTRKTHRRQGIARRMMDMLIEEAKQRGVTELSLDATKSGRPLYESCGFSATSEGMVLNLR